MEAKSTEPPVDAAVAELARRQHGVVSRAQLLAVGLSRGEIHGRLKRGRLHRLHSGVYAVGHMSLTRNARFLAAVLACGEGAALSHFSAAVHWGLIDDRGGPIHVTAPAERRRASVVVHVAPLEGERVRVGGIVVTTPARTLVDLADVAPRRLVERAYDEAHYLRLDLAGLAMRPGRSGAGRLKHVLSVHRPGTTRTRSPLEERFLALCDEHAIPRPEVNVRIEGFECDFAWRAERLIVETDGAAAHGTPQARERDPVRDAELQLNGWIVIRVPYKRLFNEPGQVAEQLRRALRPARRPAALA
jgi:REase_MTES_1575/Transcriptional regulator, AbiEi antitoxin